MRLPAASLLSFRQLAAALPLAALPAAVLANEPQNFLYPAAGSPAQRIAGLGWGGLLVFLCATFIVWVLIAWVALRRRGTLAEHAPVDANGNQGWILIGGFAIPAAILAGLFISTLDTLSAFPVKAPSDPPAIRVIGQQWWFDGVYLKPHSPDYVHVPTELHIPVGQPVNIALVTRDVIHSFWIPKLHGKVDIIPDRTNHVRLEANAPGIYQGECAAFCGEEHAGMRLLVVAQTPQAYSRWLAHQFQDAAQPSTPMAQAGERIFMQAACSLCHTIRGTAARGVIGPDLTHVGSRRRIAGGLLINNTANLEAWITHAQSLKPGAKMPNLTAFDGQQLRQLVAYLQSLR